MSTVLYVQASPRAERSYSVAVARAFLEAHGQAHPDARVETLDLFEAELPPFDGLALEAKYLILHGQDFEPRHGQAWAAVEAVIERFAAADVYVFAVPMWNFSIPYRLKHYIDLLVQPGYTFSYEPEAGYSGLLEGKRAFVAYARGGDYSEGSGFEAYDHQKPYVETILGFMGITDVRSVAVEPTLLGGPQTAAARRDEAIAEARELAAAF